MEPRGGGKMYPRFFTSSVIVHTLNKEHQGNTRYVHRDRLFSVVERRSRQRRSKAKHRQHKRQPVPVNTKGSGFDQLRKGKYSRNQVALLFPDRIIMDLLAGHELVNKNGSRVLANHALKVTKMSHG